MTWVRRSTEPDRHGCDPPTTNAALLTTLPEGSVGDLWRCDVCDALWQVTGRWDRRLHRLVESEWCPASWWQRLTHRKPRGEVIE